MSSDSIEGLGGRADRLGKRRSALAPENKRSIVATRSAVREIYRWAEWLVSTDFFPTWNRFLRYVKTPISVLILTSMVSFLCGWLVAPQCYALFVATTCVIAVGTVYPWLAVRAVECRIAFPKEQMFERDVICPELVVHNRWPIPVWGLVVQRRSHSGICNSAVDDEISVALAHVAAWTRTEFKCEVTPQRRGPYPKGDVVVTSAFPFGLWTARKNVKIDRTVVVWPWPLKLQRRHANSRRPRRMCADASTMVAGNESDVTAVRPYRAGDAMRDVHWSVSARLDEIVVKERERATEAHTRIVLELPKRVASRLRDRSAVPLDWAIRVTSGLCEACFRTRTPFTLEFGSHRFDVRSGRDRNVAMDALATARVVDLQRGTGDSRAEQHESRVRVMIDVDDANDGDAPEAFAVEMTWHLAGEEVRYRVGVNSATPRSIQDFQLECHRLSWALNRPNAQERRKASHVN